MPLGCHKNGILGTLGRGGHNVHPSAQGAGFGVTHETQHQERFEVVHWSDRLYVEQLARETAILTPLTLKLAPARIVLTEERELAFHTDFTSVYIMHSSSRRCILSCDRCVRAGNRGGPAGVVRGEMGGCCVLQPTDPGSGAPLLGDRAPGSGTGGHHFQRGEEENDARPSEDRRQFSSGGCGGTNPHMKRLARETQQRGVPGQ